MISHRLGLAASLMPLAIIAWKPCTSLMMASSAAMVRKNSEASMPTVIMARFSLMAAGAAKPTAIIARAKMAIMGARLLLVEKSTLPLVSVRAK